MWEFQGDIAKRHLNESGVDAWSNMCGFECTYKCQTAANDGKDADRSCFKCSEEGDGPSRCLACRKGYSYNGNTRLCEGLELK